MAIAPEAITAFLEKPPLDLPLFKGEDPDRLRRLIYDCTGLPVEEKTPSRPHQLEGLAFSLYKRRAMLFYWMRLGKTKIALDWASHLKRSRLASGTGIVIAHGPLGTGVWENQARTHSDLRVVGIQSGAHAAEQLTDAIATEADLVVLAWPTLQRLFTTKRANRRGRVRLYVDPELTHAAASCFSFGIVDETHFCGDALGLRYEIGSSLLANCKQRLGLTGTPVGRNPMPIWSQTSLIDEGATLGRTWFFFQEAFGKKRLNPFSKRGGTEVVFDRTKLPILISKLSGLALTYGKGEVASAEVQSNVIELDMLPAQKKAYNALIDKMIKDRMDAQQVESCFHLLRQISSGYRPLTDDEGEVRVVRIGSSKLDWLEEFFAEVPGDVQTIIFHEYVQSGQILCDLLEKLKISHEWIHGSTKNREEKVRRFQKGTARVLVANSKTGGTSIDLPQADYVCFYESPSSSTIREQAQARPMARELDRMLVVDDLVCSPIEGKMLEYVAQGQNMLRAIAQGGRRAAGSLRAR